MVTEEESRQGSLNGSEEDKGYPGFWEALLVLCVAFVPASLLAHAISCGARGVLKLPESPANLWVTIIISQSFALVLILKVSMRRNKVGWPDLFYLRPPFPALSMIAPWLVTLVGLRVSMSALADLVAFLIPIPDDSLISKAAESLLTAELVAVVFIVFVAPLLEELLCRGVLFYGFRRAYRARVAIACSALFFALIHGNPWQFFPALMAGAVLAMFVLFTGTIFMSVLGHMLLNAVTFTDFEPQLLGMMGRSGYTWWLVLPAVGLVIAGLWMLRRMGEAQGTVLGSSSAGTGERGV